MTRGARGIPRFREQPCLMEGVIDRDVAGPKVAADSLEAVKCRAKCRWSAGHERLPKSKQTVGGSNVGDHAGIHTMRGLTDRSPDQRIPNALSLSRVGVVALE